MKKTKSEQGINKKMSFAEILEKKPEAASILMEKGMHCCGCPMAMQETLEQGACAHGLDADEIVKEARRDKEQIEFVETTFLEEHNKLVALLESNNKSKKGK